MTKKKKRERKLVELWTFNHRIKLKESEKKDKYLDLAWELKKKLWNMMKMTICCIVIRRFMLNHNETI